MPGALRKIIVIIINISKRIRVNTSAHYNILFSCYITTIEFIRNNNVHNS